MDAEQPLTDTDFTQLADFRHRLRRFLHFSEEAAAAEHLTPQQHQALLAIRGFAGGAMNVGVLADRLCLKPHTTVELVQRLEKAGLVRKRQSQDDRRAVLLELTEDGAQRLGRLSRCHRDELIGFSSEMLEILSNFKKS